MTLYQMKENDVGKIAYIDDQCVFNRRLFDLGVIAGQKVVCVNRGLFGSPIAYEICGSKIALRKNDAKMIGVVL